MIAKGIIRIKCVDLANWAAREGIYDTITDENVRFSSEGLDTLIVYVPKTDSVANLLTEMKDALTLTDEKFGVMSDDLHQLLSGVLAVLSTNPCVIQQSFRMQLCQVAIAPYVEVVVKTVEEKPAE